MKRSRFTESQIVAILKEGEAGVAVAQITCAVSRCASRKSAGSSLIRRSARPMISANGVLSS